MLETFCRNLPFDFRASLPTTPTQPALSQSRISHHRNAESFRDQAVYVALALRSVHAAIPTHQRPPARCSSLPTPPELLSKSCSSYFTPKGRKLGAGGDDEAGPAFRIAVLLLDPREGSGDLAARGMVEALLRSGAAASEGELVVLKWPRGPVIEVAGKRRVADAERVEGVEVLWGWEDPEVSFRGRAEWLQELFYGAELRPFNPPPHSPQFLSQYALLLIISTTMHTPLLDDLIRPQRCTSPTVFMCSAPAVTPERMKLLVGSELVVNTFWSFGPSPADITFDQRVCIECVVMWGWEMRGSSG
ncbi:hypothetical protein BDK51DRAFT_34823 [Blyttiomyces helicus]|uniref:Uncharacterized protein n=1 Tax=Blyttiomyces helicus TaxID=388810 RepID=A0A4P9WDH7_9FUNG|nr:hypothetical protein BDK51DRAFT_34823 [Blyttiomyces helicus]|eukprot:RKO89723.1 hypothetical protein BDK51DRAFT_34823 [Blyttiomyces helicus]